MSGQANTVSNQASLLQEELEDKRVGKRFGWNAKIKLRVQKNNSEKTQYVEEYVTARDLSAGGFSFLHSRAFDRNAVILAYMPHLKDEEYVIGQIKYCEAYKGMYYKVGVEFVQRAGQVSADESTN